MVGAGGFEPPTSWSQTMRANPCATPRNLELKPVPLAYLFSNFLPLLASVSTVAFVAPYLLRI
jgi:hypothetical protein